MLRQIYGPSVERLKVLPMFDRASTVLSTMMLSYHPALLALQVETKPWQIQLPSRKLELELTTVSSNYHVEINPSDVGRNDRYVVQEIIKVSCAMHLMPHRSLFVHDKP
jgi:replication factor C subunit 3/5